MLVESTSVLKIGGPRNVGMNMLTVLEENKSV